MKNRIEARPVVSPSSLASAPVKNRIARFVDPCVATGEKTVESGLLCLCREVAGRLLRRQIETGDAEKTVREMRSLLVKSVPECSEVRARWIVDLALELIHVKKNGTFKRSPLELSLLIARAGNHLRDVRDN